MSSKDEFMTRAGGVVSSALAIGSLGAGAFGDGTLPSLMTADPVMDAVGHTVLFFVAGVSFLASTGLGKKMVDGACSR